MRRKILHAVNNSDIRGLEADGVNIGFGLNEYAISNSTDAVLHVSEGVDELVQQEIFRTLVYKLHFQKGRIGLVLGGDEAYSQLSIAAQLAGKFNVPTAFLKGSTAISAEKFNGKYLSAMPSFAELASREADVREGDLQTARDVLRDRVHGNRQSLSYMPSGSSNETPSSLPCDAHWIFLHDFFDSPGVYGANIFPSHVEWLLETVKHLRTLNANVVLKRHPNERPKNEPLINNLKARLKCEVFWEESGMSLSKICELGCKSILTVYGTVIPEATFAGIPVISAGRSPYSGFDACYEARSIGEYLSLLTKSVVGLRPKPQENGILAECSVRVRKYASRKVVQLPVYNDITPQAWTQIFSTDFPAHNYQRRSAFLQSLEAKAMLRNFLQDRDIAKELGIVTNAPSKLHERNCN